MGKYNAEFKDNDEYFDLIEPFTKLSKRIIEKRSINDSSTKTTSDKSGFAKHSYEIMLKNTTVLTNSNFSKCAIEKVAGVDDCLVIYPPIDTDTFTLPDKGSSVASDRGKDIVLVVSRFNPTKKVENAIMLARLLKAERIAKKVVIVGNLVPGCKGYYNYLKDTAARYSLGDFVRLEASVPLDRLVSLMRESKVYFHCLAGEPFGMSAAEAMSTGTISIVPNLGGFTEFVNKEYQFDTFGEAAEKIDFAFDTSDSQRRLASDAVRRFSNENYIESIKDIVLSL